MASETSRWPRLVAFAIIGYGSVELPVLADGAGDPGLWSWLSVLMGIAIAWQPTSMAKHSACSGRTWMACSIAAGVGMSLDCLRLPSALWASVCTSSGSSALDFLTVKRYVQTFPTSTSAMLIVSLAAYQREFAWRGVAACALAVARAVFDLTAMIASMIVADALIRELLSKVNQPLTVEAMSVAMTAGVFGWIQGSKWGRGLCASGHRRFLRHKTAASRGATGGAAPRLFVQETTSK
jgi:hypothetical protein